MNCIFHKWPKQWADYGFTQGGWPIQARRCMRCGKIELRTRYA